MRRTLGTLGVLWTFVSLGTPVPLHACPEADGHAAHGAAMGSEHAGHEMPGDTPTDDGSIECDCIDCCSATPAVALPRATVSVGLASAHPAPRTVASTSDRAPERSPALRLPFANGPPTIVS